MKTAILLGATGLTGGKLLQLLLSDDRYSAVKLFSRSSVGIEHPKIEEFLGDLFDFEDFKDDFTGDEVFCCIGTTKSKTPDKEMYKKIDYGIPVNAAALCKQNGITTFMVISAMGADAKSSIFYNRVKGEMEEAVLNVGIHKTFILQPSLIDGERDEQRLGEQFVKNLMKIVNFALIGPLKKYRSIRPVTIAESMVWLTNNKYDQIKIESDDIEKIAKK